MASQALYRKWRSQTFRDLVGQEHVVQTLRNAIAQDRIAHAYLFTGPRGVGKTSVARIMAKAVNCSAPLPERPCGECASCLAIADGSAVDVIEMDAASHTSVEDAREIIERVQFRPSITRFKVYIIDEVHMLSSAAFNALLKTLEEPPGHAIFIMATTESHKIPQTILSRCQKFVFKRHTLRDTAAHLTHIAAEEGVTLDSSAAESIARSATGSLRDAISILDQLMAYGSSTITGEQVRGMLGASEAAEVAALVDALLDADMPAALRAVGSIADAGADLRQYARDLVERLRALLLLQASGDASLLDVTEDDLQQMQAQAQRSDTALLLHWVRLFSALDQQLRTSSFGQLPLELAVVEALLGSPSAAPVAQPTPAVRRSAAIPPAPPVRQAPPPVARREATPPPIAATAPVKEPAAHTAHTNGATVEPAAQPTDAVPLRDKPPQPDEPKPADESFDLAPPAYLDEAPPLGLSAPPQAPADTEGPPTPPVDAVAMPSKLLADAPEVETAFLLSDVEAMWPSVVNNVKPHKDGRLIYALLKDIRPINVEGNELVLLATSEFHKKQIEKDNYRRVVERVLSKALNTQCIIRCTLDQKDAMPDSRKQLEAVRKDEWVEAVRNIFDATIDGVEPYSDDLPL
jgi:DNA polymerase III subunit gamma/tau